MSTFPVKRGLAEMMKGGVIMDVVTPEQAKIAEDAGAVAVMALERVPADIRADGGVSRMSDPDAPLPVPVQPEAWPRPPNDTTLPSQRATAPASTADATTSRKSGSRAVKYCAP